MAIKVKENAKYALVVPTSMGVRITPVENQPVHVSSLFRMQATSAETNVATISSSLGLPVKVLTAFVKDSPIASFIKSDLRSRGMEYEGKEFDQGGPWGYRHQFNIADSGYGVRGPRVCNDRAGEVGREMSVSDFDLEKLFVEDGVKVLHMSGLIAALSPKTGKLCLELAKYAKKNGTLVSFDLNYRASFWKNRESELRELFCEISSLADILIGNEEDFQLALGVKGPDAGGKDIASKIGSFEAMIENVRKEYPNASLFAATLREVKSANTHYWGAIMLSDEGKKVIEPREINVLDRIGGGDGFVGGLLYSVIKGFDADKTLNFAWACGALATTYLTDYARPADEDEVLAAASGNARVKR